MKRLITFLLTLPLLLCCAACGKNEETEAPSTDSIDTNTTERTDPSVSNPAESTAPNTETVPPAIQPEENIALTIGKYPISLTELDYYYIDTINNYCRSYQAYLSYLIDTSCPIDEQLPDNVTKKTWADNFLEMAITQANRNYALYDAAKTAGFELPKEEADALCAMLEGMQGHAESMGFTTTTAYLQSIYGERADEYSYRSYYEICTIANSYFTHYSNDLRNSFTNEDLRAYEAGRKYEFNSYTFASFYLNLDQFKEGGTKTETGNIIYSEHETNAALIKLKEAAETLASPENNTVEKLNAAIKQMEQNLAPELGDDFTYSQATENKNILYSRVNTIMLEWIRDESRMPGDITAIPYEVSTLGEDGNEIRTLKGYHIVLFQGINDNTISLTNIRHILVAFQGGTPSGYGTTIYSTAEKEATKKQAEALLKQWMDGAANEDSFAALANEHSADGDGTTGGLYENVYPGQMVKNFNDWCFDESRRPGDTGIVETEYGYHIMYYVSNSDITYRDYMIADEKLSNEIWIWQAGLTEAMTIRKIDTTQIQRHLIIDNIIY